MSIEELGAEVRRLVAEQSRREEQPYSEEVRRVAVEYALACREAGYSWSKTAAGVPLSTTTLSKWLAAARGARGMETSLVPVEVVPVEMAKNRAEEARPELVSPRGYRLLGLTVEQAISVFGRLG